jgi:hypothetical protein
MTASAPRKLTASVASSTGPMVNTSVKISQARLCRMTEQLRRKKEELDSKEQQVAAAFIKNKATRARVQELAVLLQK